MKSWLLAAGAGGLLAAGSLRGQTSLDVLEQDLDQAKLQHDQASSESFSSFITAIDAASRSPDAALDLYKAAGGRLPNATQITHHYEVETPTERAAREAEDQAAEAALGGAVQLHCGLLHYAALLTVTPKAVGLNDQWLAWLKTSGPAYIQITDAPEVKDMTMHNSIIAKYLKFSGWGEQEPGKWSLRDLPRLYRAKVLDPSRRAPTAATLDLWDTYIAMRQADQPDHDKWAAEELPSLTFDRDTDDFAIAPSIEKLGTLDALIKANPNHVEIETWISRMREMLRAYRASHGLPPGPAPAADPAPPPPPSPPASP